jgi:hypothetical protein
MVVSPIRTIFSSLGNVLMAGTSLTNSIQNVQRCRVLTRIDTLGNGLLLVLASGASDGSRRTAPERDIFRLSRGESSLSRVFSWLTNLLIKVSADHDSSEAKDGEPMVWLPDWWLKLCLLAA